jgi:diguanylate cyclase (GGDEF)-like protein
MPPSRRVLQEVDDTYRRALVGGPFYPVAWAVVGAYGAAFERVPAASWSLLAAFAGLWGLRWLHRPPPDADAPRLRRWLRGHWAIVVGTTALWGATMAWAVLDAGFAPARNAGLLATLGLATAFAHTFSMRLGYSALGIATLYVPPLLLLAPRGEARADVVVMGVYLVYVMLSLLRSHADYQRRLDVDDQLREQRDRFEHQSRHDALTDLANRRHFAERLAQACRHARDSGEPLALLVLDLDHFKAVNDTHGHVAGDACLVAFARRLAAGFCGEGVLPARLGGEEFGVLLPGSGATQAWERAEAFRTGCLQWPIDLGGSIRPVSVSIGVAAFDPARHADGDGLFRAADRAVYRAKTAGRNRVCGDEAQAA